MKVVLLAGGLGTRLMEETVLRPKPMVEVGGKPILWHIMQLYSRQGFDDFIIAAGYKAEMIKRYFMDYRLLNSDLSIDFASGSVTVRSRCDVDWRVQVVDTGPDTMTGGRLRRLAPLLRDEGSFMLTYGDGVADVDLRSLLSFHRGHGCLATVTAVRPPAVPQLTIEEGRVAELERPSAGGWINGGFFVFEPEVLEYIPGDSASLEEVLLTRLAREGELKAYRHEGYWQCMDTLADRQLLESLWREGRAPWVRAGGMNRAALRS